MYSTIPDLVSLNSVSPRGSRRRKTNSGLAKEVEVFIDPVTKAVEEQLTSHGPYVETADGKSIKKRLKKPQKILVQMISDLEKMGEIQIGKKRRRRRRGRTERSRAYAGGHYRE